MTQYELQEKLKELDKNENFISKMANVENAEDAAEIFGEYGITISAGELEKALQAAATTIDNGGELDEATLENVSGGVAFTTLCVLWMCCNIVVAGCSLLQRTVFRKRQKI